MGHLPILRLFGSPVIGGTGEENGFGSPVIGRDVQGLTPFGCLATGRQEGEVGSGIKDVGSIGEFQFGVMSSVFGVINNSLK